MLRDNRGRFIRKAQGGTSLGSPTDKMIIIDGKQRTLMPGYWEAFSDYKTKHNPSIELTTWAQTPEGLKYLQPLPSDQPVDSSISASTTAPTDKIKYYIKNNQKFDLDGNVITEQAYSSNRNNYQIVPNPEEPSAGMHFFDSKTTKKDKTIRINKQHLANFLDFTRAGLGSSINNKIADRALKAETPLLQDVSESHRNVFGDYSSVVQGEKAAAQLRNLASKPLTSDGALQQKMQLEAQIQGQQYIDQGRDKDDELIRQTREVAWQQNKENQIQRHAAAMQNRQAMLMSAKNKEQIRNMRDSANYSQVVSPLLSDITARLRKKATEQQQYQDYFDQSMIHEKVWNTYDSGLTADQIQLRDLYNTGGITAVSDYITGNPKKESDWVTVSRILKAEEQRRLAELHGVILDDLSTESTNQYGIFGGRSPYGQFAFKQGGTVYKARLTKRTRDNDRAFKSIESSKKIAAKFLEKAMDSLYTYDQVELIAKPKKKKRKYQAGGALPFVSYSPSFSTSESGAPQPQATSKKKSDDEDEGLISKDISNLIESLDPLPIDMLVIEKELRNFENLSNLSPTGEVPASVLTSRYFSILSKIKIAKFNREEYTQALNQLKSNGGLNEYAITSDGLLIGTNANGDFQYFSAEDIKQGKPAEEGYSILTNSNLLYLRANSAEAAFNHKLTSVAQNGISISTVTKLIQDVISHLGTSSEASVGYVQTQQGDLIQGLQDFYEAIQTTSGDFDGTIHDLYKGKILTKSQAEQAKKAMQYIYLTLPENAKTLLKVKSDGSDIGAIQLIETLISSQLKPEHGFEVTLEGGKTSKSGNSGTDNTDLKTSLPLNVQKGIGGVDSYVQVDRGDGIHWQVRGTQYNFITTTDGKPIQNTSLANMLALSGLQGLVKDMRNIQFGDQKISIEALSNITYNNTGITRANLPVKPDGSVNFDLLEAYEKAEQDLDMSADKSPEKIRQVYGQYGITSLLNADGSYNQSKFAPFIVTEGYTTDALSGLKTSKFVMEYRGDEDAAVDLITRCLTTGSGKDAQTPDIDTFSWYNPADWFGWTDTIYKGVVYIPITNNVNAAIAGANQSLDYNEALDQEEKYQNFERMSNQRSTDADLLKI